MYACAVGLAIAAFWSVGLAAASDAPPREAGGQTLAVPDDQLARGEVYHIAPGVDTQVVMTADAPLLRMTATCSRVVGYVVAPFDLEEGQPPVVAAALRLPVASLRCGVEALDARLHGPRGLSAAEHPEITACLRAVRDVAMLNEDGGRKTYSMTAAGDIRVRGEAFEIEVPVRVTFVPFTWQTMQRSYGDMLIVRARFELEAARLLARPSPGDLSPERVQLDVFLMCSTMSPAKNLDPSISTAHYLKQLDFLTALRDFNAPDRAYALGRSFAAEVWDDAPTLNRLAAAVLTEPGIERRDLAFVERLVRRANALTRHADAVCLDTLARWHDQRGELEDAVRWARAAVEHLDGVPDELAGPIRAALESYQQALRSSAEAAEGPAEAARPEPEEAKPSE